MAKNIGKIARLEKLARAACEECTFKTSRIRLHLETTMAVVPRCKGAPVSKDVIACNWSTISKKHKAITDRISEEYYQRSCYEWSQMHR